MLQVVHMDCLAGLRMIPDNFADSIVTDPPYGLSFMGRKWDYDVPSEAIWRECLRVLKPGGHLLAFAGTRTQHRMAVRIEDAGFEIRDMIAWVYGSGFPKSLDVSKAIDKTEPRAGMFSPFAAHFAERLKVSGKSQKEVAALFPSKTGGITGCVWNWANGANVPTVAQWSVLHPLLSLSLEYLPLIKRIEAEREVVGYRDRGFVPGGNQVYGEYSGDTRVTAPATDAARQWQGWGTALKPALEPITVARKPLEGTVASNILAHGVGGLNIDGCRVGDEVRFNAPAGNAVGMPQDAEGRTVAGRWPANLIHDGSDEVLGAFPHAPGQLAKASTSDTQRGDQNVYGDMVRGSNGSEPRNDAGSAARFFYCAKSSKSDRGEGNTHPTVKPTDLMRYLCRLVTPPGGLVLDPFTGSGSTGKAAALEGFKFLGFEREAEYVAIARARIAKGAM
jgi:hypothetical protein